VGTVIMHNVVSVDGFIADHNDDVGPLHEWYFSGDTPLVEGSDGKYDHSGAGVRLKVSGTSAEYVKPMWDGISTIVMGRHLFDLVSGWEGRPPAGDHVVVVSHQPKPEGWHPEASYSFVDDVSEAIATAQELAGERTIAVNAGDVGSQRGRTRRQGDDGPGSGGVRFGQAVLRRYRWTAPARRSVRGDPG
jgi:dihydrofolate reductase